MSDSESQDIEKMPEESRWNYFLGKVLSVPGVKVNRGKFLRESFADYYDYDKGTAIVENGTLKTGISFQVLDLIAKKVINHHNTLAAGASALSGIPGGLAMLGTIPADLVQ